MPDLRYESGETPQRGDVVRGLDFLNPEDLAVVGKVDAAGTIDGRDPTRYVLVKRGGVPLERETHD